MGQRRLILPGMLMLVVVATAARSYSRPSELPIDLAAGVAANTPVPAPVMATLRRACFDCHSNETSWPWYAALPVASWLVERDVREGRGQLNFSRWMQYSRFERSDLLDKACEKATTRAMPLWQYRVVHRDARLSDADIIALCSWSREEATRLAGGVRDADGPG